MDRRRFLKHAGNASIAAAGASLFGGHLLSPQPKRMAIGQVPPGNRISLAGGWRFRLDPENTGSEYGAWYKQRLPERIQLPGSTDEAGYGLKTMGPEFGHLSRAWRYTGVCWYQKEVNIPEDWQRKRITLFLERCHWTTKVWIDDREIGSCNSLVAPHVYDLTEALIPGSTHRLTLRVDNSYLIPVGENAHSVTDHTQTNWNGIVGRIELRATDPVWIDALQVYPQVEDRAVRLEGTIKNITGQVASGKLALTVRRAGEDQRQPMQELTKAIGNVEEERSFHITMPLGEDVALWNEFDPALYEVDVQLSGRAGNRALTDRRRSTFGMCEIGTAGTRFTMNGHPVFLRGTLECCIFPKTGYPPTDVAAWARLYRIAREHGLNHFRFHSWCPPEAAFVAADQAGFMLQVELPVWSWEVGEDADLSAFMQAEADRILRAYGNHPSFTMMALGNELKGDWSFMNELVDELKQKDPRHLYTTHTDYFRKTPEPSSQYYITTRTEDGMLRIRGSSRPQHAFGTNVDFSRALADIRVPTVSHELGQWVVNPDYSDLEKYDGPLKPRNLKAYREVLAEHDMLDQAERLQQATGRFSWLIYKEEIETALRTPDFGGFQLLQLQDYPGQGEALVGLLDAFWDAKGLFTPEAVRRFCSETVPLLRMDKFVWTAGETFRATAQVNHYGREALQSARSTWTIRDDDGAEWASGRFEPTDVPVGSVTTLGQIDVPIASVEEARHLTVEVRLEDTPAANDWELWVYPEEVDTLAPEDEVMVAERFDEEVRRALADGRKVLLLSPVEETGPHAIEAHFLPVFWSIRWFREQPTTVGILCDPEHPALVRFPTDFHSNWQWQALMQPSKAFVLDEAPEDYRPLVQVVDDFHHNRRLAALFETRVGEGYLLASGLNLQGDLSDRPVARQMRHSLLAYMVSEQFNPQAELDDDLLEQLLA